ncbi:Crp/Fnr family transcriptional regulator [Methylobacterium planeticum]|uniref:Crp/Fnr family transcriptional regulator n=1 Tax=Methylobacterium planeticum TaxID=2615211 RepID=A0A6N6MXS4_9HYPH|nr:Crp/Fnr family transcriptional regulator [Methylobacterium planeticum]KAB1076058.1 Crp/Fnr family transcriptional regulator [Methylobacterium planeticum]
MKSSDFSVLLRLNPLFSDLGPEVVETLSAMSTTRSLRAGEVLFRENDLGDALYGIRRGEILIETGSEAGKRVVLNTLGAGDIFGEIALLDGQPRTADALAMEPTDLFVLRRSDLLSYLSREPAIAIKLIELLCARVRYIAGQMNEMTVLPLSTRLARRLTVLAEDFGSEIQISQEQLGAYVGSTRESVNRQLQAWRKAGHLDLKRGCIMLRNKEALSKHAGRHDARDSDW